MNTIRQDLRYAVRTAAKKPGFALFAIVTLALGIGVNTTVFSVVNAVLFTPLAVQNPDELIRLYQRTADGAVQQRLSYPDYKDYKEHSTSLNGLAAVALTPFRLESPSGAPRQILGEAVSANFFTVLKVNPAKGRTFLEEEDAASKPVVMISHDLWEKTFSSDPGVLEKTLRLNGQVHDIIGVVNQEFAGTFAGARVEVWVPLTGASSMMGSQWQHDRTKPSVHVIARRKSSSSPEQVQAEFTTLSLQLEKAYPETNVGKRIETGPATLLHGKLRKAASIFFAAFMALMGLVLLIACANLAGLMVTKSLERRREMAIRISLGADRGRLTRQLLTESLLLATVGGIAGLLAAVWSADLLIRLWPIPTVPFHFDFRPNATVFLFAIAVTFITGILLGIAPVLQAGRRDVLFALKEETGTSSRRKMRIRNVLVVSQISFSLLLLICAGLFIRSWTNAQEMNAGFNPENMVAMDISLSDQNFSREEGLRYFKPLRERILSLSEVASLSFADLAPVDIATAKTEVVIEGHHPPEGQKSILISSNTVAPGYFQTLQLPLMSGRDFSETDDGNATGVAIVNETMARRYWPGEAALGKQFKAGKEQKAVTVIGIARDSKYRTPGEEATPHMYLSHLQFYEPGMTMLVRVHSNPKSVLIRIEKAMSQVDNNVQAFFARTMEEHLAFSLLPARLGASLLSAFGFLGLLLASIGIYAAVSFHVTQRKREIGIRMAVGAAPKVITKLFVEQGLRLSLIGSIIGILLALAATRFLSSLLVGVGAGDPGIFAGVSLLMIAISFLACAVPAWQASRVDPLRALRYE